MERTVIKGIIIAALFIFAGSNVHADAQTVSGSIGAVARGGKARGTVVLNIPGGLHVNSNRPASEYAIPTTVRLSGSGVKLTGVSYPRGKNKKFQFSENPINIYEGRVAFPFTVTVPSNFRGNTIRVRAVVRFQPCTDEVCYAPRTSEVTLTARVK